MADNTTEHETPRQRRERIFTQQRSRRRFGLRGALAVIGALAVLAVGWGAYHRLGRPSTPAEVPVIRADDQPTRKRPAEPGGIAADNSDSLVLNRTQPKVEQLLPPPETPLPRPAASEPAPPPAAPETRAASAPPAPAPTLPATVAPAPETASPPVAKGAAPAPSPPAPAERTARAAPPPASQSPAHGYRLQLGSVRTEQAAQQTWQRLKQQNADVLGSLGLTAARADLGDRGVFYRIQAGPLADAAAAERACTALKRRGVECLLVKP